MPKQQPPTALSSSHPPTTRTARLSPAASIRGLISAAACRRRAAYLPRWMVGSHAQVDWRGCGRKDGRTARQGVRVGHGRSPSVCATCARMSTREPGGGELGCVVRSTWPRPRLPISIVNVSGALAGWGTHKSGGSKSPGPPAPKRPLPRHCLPVRSQVLSPGECTTPPAVYDPHHTYTSEPGPLLQRYRSATYNVSDRNPPRYLPIHAPSPDRGTGSRLVLKLAVGLGQA